MKLACYFSSCRSVFFLSLAATALLVRTVNGQNILLKSGQTVETKGVRRHGEMIMGSIAVGQSRGEVGYPISAISRIKFPEPPQLKTTVGLLTKGEPEKALVEIKPVVKYYEPFREIAGNYWAQAALLEVSALAGMQLDKEAGSLGEEIRKNSTDPETARAAQLQVVKSLIYKEEYDKAVDLCENVIKESAQPSVLAEAWVKIGDAYLAQRIWDKAELAYLHVPVFYEDAKLWMPPALLGSARAFRGLEDLDRAKKTLNDLTTKFPRSPQAKIARGELQNLPK